MKKLNFNKILLIILAVLAIAGILLAAYYYREYRMLKANPQAASEEEVRSIVAEIGKIMDLPNDEEPSLATILDKEKIKDQPFFKNAENGDKLLAYSKAMKAILYRPSTGRIIEVAPLTIDQPSGAPSAAALKIAYYNGSGEAGRSSEAEKKVKAAYADFATGEVKDAQADYDKTLVVDVSGNRGAEAAEIAKLLNASVGTLPEGEAKPAADLLIISGKE